MIFNKLNSMVVSRTNLFFLLVLFLFSIYFVEVMTIARLDNIDVYIRSYVFNIIIALFLTALYSFLKNKYIGVIFLLFLGIIEFSNILYIRFSGSPLSLLSILYVKNLTHVQSSIWGVIRFWDIFYFIPAILFASIKTEKEERNYIKSLQFLLIIIAVFFTFQVFAYRNFNFYRSFIILYNVSRSESSYKNTVFSNIIIETYDNLRLKKLSKNEREKVNNKIIANYFIDSISGSHLNMNIIYILVESFESWPINKEYQGKEITPFLNSLIRDKKTTSFLNVTPHVQIGRSVDAQLMINTGLYANRKRVTYQDFANNEYFSLPRILKKHNGIKSTSAYIGDRADFYNIDGMSSTLGYDNYVSIEKLKRDDVFNMGLSDESFYRQTAEILKKETQPFFSLLITLSSHSPFIIPEDKKKIDITEESMIENYMQSASYADYSLSMFFKYLKEANLFDNSIIIINGDHEGLGGQDKQLAFKTGKFKNLLSEEFAVPFIIVNDPNPKGVQNSRMSQIDIYPTLLDHLEINSYWRGLGISAFDKSHPNIGIYSDYSFYGIDTNNYKKVFLSKWDLSELIIENDLFADSIYKKYR